MHKKALLQNQITNKCWALWSYRSSKLQALCITCLVMSNSEHLLLTMLWMLKSAWMRWIRSDSQKFIQSLTSLWGRLQPQRFREIWMVHICALIYFTTLSNCQDEVEPMKGTLWPDSLSKSQPHFCMTNQVGCLMCCYFSEQPRNKWSF